MSYCVNCGVELSDSEKDCPLCGAPVINPAKVNEEETIPPYPSRLENIYHGIDVRYGVLLATIGMAIPVVCCLLIDIFMHKRISWSLFVAGGMVCVFVWFLFPFLLKKRNPYLLILYNAATLLVYLAGVFCITEGIRAYLLLVVPICLSVCGFAYAVTPILRCKKLRHNLNRYSIIAFMTSMLCIVIEIIIDLYTDMTFTPYWSIIAMVPLTIVGLMLVMIEGKHRLKEKIRRRLYL